MPRSKLGIPSERLIMRRISLLIILSLGLMPLISASAQGEGPLREKLRERLLDRAEKRAAKEAPVPGVSEYSYGNAPLQTLDFWKAPQAGAPLVIFVHGGGWKRGDKRNATGRDKVTHWLEQGYAVASLNYRLVPAATVEQQAQDIADGIAYLHRKARILGFDPNKIVLTGHSAGAHLVALVGTDERYLKTAHISFSGLRGIIPIDGAAYDVSAQMGDNPGFMLQTYEQAFGTDPERQRALSPTLQTASPNATNFLIIHVQRDDGIRQAKALAAALEAAGTAVTRQGFEGTGLKGHMEINRSLGDPTYPATSVVDAWLKARFAD